MQKRLDVLLFEKGFFSSREKAKEGIEEGIIFYNGQRQTKPGKFFDEECDFEIVGEKLKYVSRAGLKLEKAVKEFSVDFTGKIVLDIGASTGGFTDFALQNNAKKVLAVDVGRNQLADQLKNNDKVVSFEDCDIRNFKTNEIIDIIVCDVSFISLKLISSKIVNLLKQNGELIILIKPQFECGIKIAKKFKGVIKDDKIKLNIKNDIIQHFCSKGLCLVGDTVSPILGTKGNEEFLAVFKKI